MVINDLEEFIDYTCSTGATPNSSLFTKEECLQIENLANCGSIKSSRKL